MSIGADLAQARQRAGLTISQISQRTRIRETIIRGIEHDDYSGCGGDFYARGHIRAIAHAVGADADPLIGEYDAARTAHEEITAAQAFEPIMPVPVTERLRLNWTALLGLALLAVAVLGGYLFFFSGSPSSPGAAGRTGPATGGHHPASPPDTSTGSSSAQPPAGPGPLTPARALAFGPGGVSQGDSPQLAGLAVDASPATFWHSDWYDTAAFGGLQDGTGLLLRMGHPVTITGARITLGRARGADLQLRVGPAPRLAALRPVASATDAGGVLRLTLASPVRGRYVLVWFTRLPPDFTGTYQARVYDIRLSGRG